MFNLAIRGINGLIIHCDTMTRESWGAFFIQNIDDKLDGFSTINRLSYTRESETHLKIKFVDKKYPDQVEIDTPTG